MRTRLLLWLFFLGWLAGAAQAEPVAVQLDGVGWRTGARLERVLTQVLDTPAPAEISNAQLEDLLFILRNELRGQGFLDAQLDYTLRDDEGNTLGEGRWSAEEWLPMASWPAVAEVRLNVEKGPRRYFETVHFTGLSALPVETARAFFYPSGALFISEAERAYSPGRLRSGVSALQASLIQQGYLEAQVSVAGEPQISEDVAVTVGLTVVEGPRFQWGEVTFVGFEDLPAAAQEVTESLTAPRGPFQRVEAESLVRLVRNGLYHRGFAEAQVQLVVPLEQGISEAQVRLSVETRGGTAADDPAWADVRITVTPGPQLQRGEVRFAGYAHTARGFLRRTAFQQMTELWLNPLEVDAAVFALGQFGIFDAVEATLVEPEGERDGDLPTRDVHFMIEERDRFSLSTLAGWGSYEQLRLGLEGQALNIFGRAHVARFRLRQSFRSSGGQVSYTVPRPFLGFTIGQARLAGLLRDEVAFERQEALVSLGLRRPLGQSAWDLSLEYRFELLRSRDLATEELVGDTRANVGSLLLGLAWDTRDRVIAPREGSAFSAELELASTALGAAVDYPRLEIRASHHRALRQDSVFGHLGFTAGALDPIQMSESTALPFNKRFFPGGENSLRGYTEGEASPRDAAGEEIGAEAFALVQAETELRLTRSLSGVFFVDGLWTIDRFTNPDHTWLASLGIGLRYSTPLGPLRLEYGHNLNPRPGDPSGTFHFALGTAF